MGKIIAITEKEKELVKDYHSKEYNDKSIVEATGLSYNKVYYIRHMLLNLPPYNNRKTVAKNGELILTADNKDVVLKNNEKYVYDFRFNLSNGAICNFDILKKDKDSIVSIVNEVLKTGIKFGSIDIVKSNNEFYVLEVNSGVMMDNLIIENNYYDEAYKIYKDAIRDLFYM